jgi:3-phosphoshikimate 1-carboxyvinyltransferase
MNTNVVNFIIKPGSYLQGRIRVPGDKSISHRAIMLSALAQGTSEVFGFLAGQDCLDTLRAFQQMGVRIEGPEDEQVVVHGVSMQSLRAPNQALDLGNSGTSMRLLTGILAAQTFNSVLTGDASLQKRPMARVADPLRQMGAKIELTEQCFPPITITGKQQLRGINYAMPIASAQVKSCLLLAGLYAEGITTIIEPAPSRDHTERMLETLGYSVQHHNSTVSILGGGKLRGCKIQVPGDISSAAFFIVGATIAPRSDLLINDVGMNPTRVGIINILRLMGADITVSRERMVGNEPIADLRIRSAKLNGIDIPLDQVPLAIDEFPAIFIAAACASGVTTLHGASELRVKESDRIQVMAEGLQALGISAEPLPDGIRIEGGHFHGGRVNSHGDHRIAMAFAMAGMMAADVVEIEDCVNVATSFPGFITTSQSIGLEIKNR